MRRHRRRRYQREKPPHQRRGQGGLSARPVNFDGRRERLSDLEPDEVLVERLGLIPGLRVLDLGMGEGDHSLWLASKGFEVEGVDIDQAVLSRAELRAIRLRQEFEIFVADMTRFYIMPGVYDLILACASLHALRPSVLPDLAARIVAGLRPGGLLYATVITSDDPGYAMLREAGAPEVEPDTFDLSDSSGVELLHFFAPGELNALFTDLETVHAAEERYLRPGSDQGYNGAAVLLARKRPT